MNHILTGDRWHKDS